MSVATRKRSYTSPKSITTKKVMNEAQNVGLSLVGLYAGALVNKPLSDLLAKIFPSSSDGGDAVSGFDGIISDYAVPVSLLASGMLLPMVFNFGQYKSMAQSVLTGVSLYGASAVLKQAMGKNLLAGGPAELGEVVTNYRELNAAADNLPAMAESIPMSV